MANYVKPRSVSQAAYCSDDKFIVTSHRDDESGERIFTHFRRRESYFEWANLNPDHAIWQDDFGVTPRARWV